MLKLKTFGALALLGVLAACQAPPPNTATVTTTTTTTTTTATAMPQQPIVYIEPASAPVVVTRVAPARTAVVAKPPVRQTVSVPTRRVVATVTPIPPTVGRTVIAEIDVPLKVGKAPPGAVRSSRADWKDPQFDCARANGVRTKNPSTGEWSCFIYDGTTKQ